MDHKPATNVNGPDEMPTTIPTERNLPDKTMESPVHAEGENASSANSTPSDGDTIKRDAVLAKLNQDRDMTHVKAWEENEKSKSLNKYNRKLSKILAWENTKKATAEASLRRGEEKLEKKKAAYIEKMRNKMASVHRRAEEKKAKAEVKKGEAYVKAEEMAAKYHIYGRVPNSNKWLQCCGR